MSDIRITNCEFSHTAMTGLFVSHVSNLVADRNVFTDIGELLLVLLVPLSHLRHN